MGGGRGEGAVYGFLSNVIVKAVGVHFCFQADLSLKNVQFSSVSRPIIVEMERKIRKQPLKLLVCLALIIVYHQGTIFLLFFETDRFCL